jgi:hypothetical protein
MMPQARTEARFYLLIADQSTGFDFMAECHLCGAMTEQPLVVKLQQVVTVHSD